MDTHRKISRVCANISHAILLQACSTYVMVTCDGSALHAGHTAASKGIYVQCSCESCAQKPKWEDIYSLDQYVGHVTGNPMDMEAAAADMFCRSCIFVRQQQKDASKPMVSSHNGGKKFRPNILRCKDVGCSTAEAAMQATAADAMQ